MFDIIDIDKLDPSKKQRILQLYDDLKSIEFPSLTEQFENHFEGRVKLDSELLEILGFERSDIEKLLPEVYESIAFELKNG